MNGDVLTQGHRIYVVFDGDDSGTGRGVAIHIGRGQGDGVGTDIVTTEVGDIQGKVGDAAGIVATVVDCGGIGATGSVGVKLDGDILTKGDRSNIVFYGDDAGTGRGVAIHIGHGQGDGVASYIVTIEAGIVKAQAGDGAIVAGTIVYIRGGNASIAVGIELHGHILAEGDRCDIVFNTYIRSTGRGVAMDVRHGQGDSIASNIRAIEGGIVEAQTGDATSIGRTIIDVSRGNGRISGWVQLDGDVLADRIRSYIVFYGDVCRAV